jgi:uncharacterized protein (TIGR00299 family) protein
MKVAYFDCQFGAAGDMLVAALIDAGLNETQWRAELAKIALPKDSFSVSFEDVIRCSVTCKKMKISPDEMDVDYDDEHAHEHERSYVEIREIINKSQISQKAKDLACAIFQRLGEAEAKVHGVKLEDVHFHEVGSIDSIVDIVGFAIGYDLLRIEKSFVSPLPLGGGTVKTAHGLFPVPGPAVVELISKASVPIAPSDFQYECLTPTGAAILTTIASGFGNNANIQSLESTGTGGGTFNPKDHPNVCRIMIGEGVDNLLNGEGERFATETILVLEANIDDCSPQALAYAQEQLFAAGALDVFVVPALMKKNRSGHLLTVLCKSPEANKLKEIILCQTTTIGVRSYFAERTYAERKFEEVTLAKGGRVRVKIAFDKFGKVINIQPEYEDCASYASAHNLPLKDVISEAQSKLQVAAK